ncbi:MAG: carboxypeptidase regulatory-like domain-containing protein, partial [Gemmatimonadales bacterium]
MALSLLGAVKILLAVQAAQATVAGTVRDAESGRPIESALVALTDLERAVSTGADGRYVLLQVPPGPHHIPVRFIGYSQRTLHALGPRDGQLEIHVSLRPEPVRLPTIEVRPPVAVRGVDNGDSTAFPDRGTSMAAVWNHPLLAEPDAFQALGGGEVVLNPESPSGVHIRGGASDQTGYLLDGIPVFSPYHAAGVFSAWNPDALAGLHLSSSAPSPEHPDALAGVIAGVTRAPGPSLRAQGSLSTTQARLTLDGPVGIAGASFLVSLRSGAPYFLSKHEPSYLKSEVGDWLAKLEAPALGGRIRLLGYDNDNEIGAASGVNATPSADPGRNVFEWRSRSLGAEWHRAFPGFSLRILGWHAGADAGSVWAGQDGAIDLTATRRDQGLVAAVEHNSARGSTVTGLRVERSRTAYRLESDSATGPSWAMSARTPVATLFAQHARALGHHFDLRVGAALASTGGDRYWGPRVQLGWAPSDRLTLVASSARTHQFAQSLRNSESVVGNVFPADLYIG